MVIVGPILLQSDAHQLKIRPNPDPGCLVELGFLGLVLHVEIAHSTDVQHMTETSFNGTYDRKTHVRLMAYL
jgi:hypothetical protein